MQSKTGRISGFVFLLYDLTLTLAATFAPTILHLILKNPQLLSGFRFFSCWADFNIWDCPLLRNQQRLRDLLTA